MSNHPMISPTISDLSETLHTASPLLVYGILKVIAHFIRWFSRNSILIFRIFPKKLQNRIFLKLSPLTKYLFLNVQTSSKLIIMSIKHYRTPCNHFQTDLKAFTVINFELNLVQVHFYEMSHNARWIHKWWF